MNCCHFKIKTPIRLYDIFAENFDGKKHASKVTRNYNNADFPNSFLLKVLTGSVFQMGVAAELFIFSVS